MKERTSPDSFITMGFYYMFSAALQRKVWLQSDLHPIFPNIYVLLVAPAAVGKGLVLSPVTSLLKFHKKKSLNESEHLTQEQKALLDDIAIGKKNKDSDERLLIPVGADATTYEALLRYLAKATGSVIYKQDGQTKIYTHASVCFCLEEASSLFRKHTEDVVNLLVKAWDCGDYTYDTKTQGKDVIKRACINFLAGTTPSFMQRVFTDELLTEGYASRTIFVYESTNRFNRLRIPDPTAEQLNAYKDIAEHLGRVAKLYGRVEFTAEAEEFLEDWWCNIHPTKKINSSDKLDSYYGRKNLHVQKLAMAVHFSDNVSMTIPKQAVIKALELLELVERKMHLAICISNTNPIAKLAKKIYRGITREGGQTRKLLLAEHYGDAPNGLTDIDEAIKYLLTVNKIQIDSVRRNYYVATEPDLTSLD